MHKHKFFSLFVAPIEESTDVSIETVEGLCGGHPADIIFLLDASSSIWGPNFQKELQFVKEVVDKFDVSAEMTHVAAFTFSDMTDKEIGLHAFTDRFSSTKAITNLRQLRGGTRTDLALEKAQAMMTKDGRKDVPHLVIVMTDGKSDLPGETQVAAQLLKNHGISTFAVGIGESVDHEELKGIASQEDYVFTVNTFDALVTLKTLLAKEACSVEVIMQADDSMDNINDVDEQLAKGALHYSNGEICPIIKHFDNRIVEFYYTILDQ